MRGREEPSGRVLHLLWAIIGCAVLARVAGAFYLGDAVTPLPGIWDQISYHTLAMRVLEGHGFTFGTGWWPATAANEPTAHWSFVYVLFLTGIYAVAGPHALIARLVQAVMVGILQPLLTWRIAHRLFGPRAGLASAAIAAGYAYFVYYAGGLLTESFYIVAILWALDTALELADASGRPDRRVTARLWARLGLGLAVAVLLRQVLLLVVPLILGWVAWQVGRPGFGREQTARGRPATAVAGLVVAVLIIGATILPWTVRNYLAFHEFVLLNTNAGFAFFWGNHPIHGTRFMPLYPGGPAEYRAVIPPELRGLNEARMERALLRRGIGFVTDDPVRFVLLSVSRVKEYVKFWPSTDSSRLSNWSRVLSFGLCLPLMLLGVGLTVTAGAADVDLGDRGHVPAGVWLLIGFSLMYSLIHILTWTLVRYRLPVDAVMIPFAGLALVTVYDRLWTASAALLPWMRSRGASA